MLIVFIKNVLQNNFKKIFTVVSSAQNKLNPAKKVYHRQIDKLVIDFFPSLYAILLNIACCKLFLLDCYSFSLLDGLPYSVKFFDLLGFIESLFLGKKNASHNEG
jgi:hypothetical protein